MSADRTVTRRVGSSKTPLANQPESDLEIFRGELFSRVAP